MPEEASLSPINQYLWEAAAPYHVWGIPIPHRMTVVRLDGHALMLHSPCPFNETLAKDLREIGRVGHIVAPSLFHCLGLDPWFEAFPDAQFHAPHGFEKEVKKCPDFRPLDAIPAAAWRGTISHHPIDGMPKTMEVGMLHIPSESLLVADLVFNFKKDAPGLFKPLTYLAGIHEGLSISRIYASYISDKRAFRDSVKDLLEYDFERLIPGHGHIVYHDARNMLQETFLDFVGANQ